MPCATIHMLTAGRVLGAWERRPDRAPFPVDRPGLRRAFLLGAMGPDIGFVPGVDRLVSELAHYVSSADLARHILYAASTPEQSAYAWGWSTHHVTDVEIHPLVGRACGEHLLGDRSVRLNSSDDLETHVAMEVGLDLLFLREDPEIPTPPSGPGFDRSGLGFLARALEETYRIPWEVEELHASHRAAVARTARWPSAVLLLGRSLGLGDAGDDGRGPLHSVLGWTLGGAARVIPYGTAASGFLKPLSPPAWLVRRVREVADRFAERFQEHVEDRLAGLENRNLETGRAENAPVEHPDSARARMRLRELQKAHGGAALREATGGGGVAGDVD